MTFSSAVTVGGPAGRQSRFAGGGTVHIAATSTQFADAAPALCGRHLMEVSRSTCSTSLASEAAGRPPVSPVADNKENDNMNGEWVDCTIELPDQGTVVDTMIRDENGTRNEGRLKREGSLWFTPDGAMYVYYCPTHWFRTKP